ncbi:hypothetical protein SAMN05421772_1402 [Paracoccus saliphilus]|uniref:Uncharacterized protein n=1 Tax=Paracoccus saliphilus TaxID=405559 RepID=A0AA45W8R1_9RHOB|nr:hypothetical protein SAMN05421772_1402 [Paracoccus saliphilus]
MSQFRPPFDQGGGQIVAIIGAIAVSVGQNVY